jgi:RNA polymerase sigma-70 factor (ECF subfamily)
MPMRGQNVGMPALTDEDVAAAAAGEPMALRRIYELLAPAILGYLKTRGSEDADDLTQDVFVALLPQIRTVRGGARGLRTLAFSIAHARLVDELRRRTRRQMGTAFDPDDDPRVAASAEDHAMAQLRDAELVELIAGLSDDQRTVVALRVVGQLSLEETATVIGRSIGAVKQLQRRGLIALRDRLQTREGVTT